MAIISSIDIKGVKVEKIIYTIDTGKDSEGEERSKLNG